MKPFTNENVFSFASSQLSDVLIALSAIECKFMNDVVYEKKG